MVLGMTSGAPSAGQFTGSGNLSGVGGYAGGGTVQAKTPIMVGERGAEMFIPNNGGVVRNAQDTRMASGGKPVVVNQNKISFNHVYSINIPITQLALDMIKKIVISLSAFFTLL